MFATVQPIPTHPIEFHQVTPDVRPDSRFPRAVAGEDYDRYTRATWRQAERWLKRNAHRVSDAELAMQEAREILWSVATTDVARRLYPQEERQLTELIQLQWTGARR